MMRTKEAAERVSVDRAKCTKCGACARDCVVNVLSTDETGYPRVVPQDARFCLKCQHCLAVCPVGAIVCNGIGPDAAEAPGPLPGRAEMLNLVRQRRSIRQWSDAEIAADDWRALLDSLRWMPTGCNDHRLHFVVVRDRAEMDRYRADVSAKLRKLARTGLPRLIPAAYRRSFDEIVRGDDVIFRNAPHMIVAATPRNAPCREADPWIALTSFGHLAQSMGLGTCWCGFGVHAFKWMGSIRRRLALPKGYEVGAVMLFGRPGVAYARTAAPGPVGVCVQ